MSETRVEIDVFDPIHRAATDAGIDLDESRLLPVELTDDGDLTVEIREGDRRLPDQAARRVALKAVGTHDLPYRLAADLADRSTEWVEMVVHEEQERDRDE